MLIKFKLSLQFVAFLSLSIICIYSPNLCAQEPVKAKIIEGTLRPVSEYPMVAQLYIGDFTCTGTLVGSHYILTAAHCFYDEDSNRITNTSSMSATLGGNTYSVKKVSVNPSYVSRSDACVPNEVDAAVIELTSDVNNVSPVPLLRSAPQVGTQLLIVGFGVQGNGSSGENDTFPNDGFVNIGYTSIERVSSNLYVDWDFNPGESNTASGDSGSPAFMDIDGIRYINSITCGGTGKAEYGTESTNTRADAIASWVDSILGVSSPGTQPVSKVLKIAKAKVDFGDNNNYTFVLQGSVDLGKNFNPKGATVHISFANYSDSFKLSKSGYAERRGGDDYVELTGKMSGGKFKTSTVKFDIELADKESLYDNLADFFPESPSAETRVDLPITVDVKGNSYNATVSMKPQKLGQRWTK